MATRQRAIRWDDLTLPKRIERARHALEASHYNVTQAAKSLGLKRTTLLYFLNAHLPDCLGPRCPKCGTRFPQLRR